MAFRNLPIELNERIATYLPSDRDLCNFTLISQETNQAVQHIRSGVWRRRFAYYYDVPPGKTGYQMKLKYQARRKSFSARTHFTSGHGSEEQEHLKAIRELILESFMDTPRNAVPKLHSKNLEQLRGFVQRSNILKSILQMDGSHELLQTIQLLLIPWSLEFKLGCPVHSFSSSQQAVYSHPETNPLFLDKYKTHVNITFLLHITNFFKYHMTHEQEATLFAPFHDLEDDEKPKLWQKYLEQGTRKLGETWKGSYGEPKCRLLNSKKDSAHDCVMHIVPIAYLHDLRDVPIMRSFDAGEHVIVDSIDHAEDGFQTLDLDFAPENCRPWPAIFDEHLNSYPSPALLRKLSNYAADTEQPPGNGLPSPPPTPASAASVGAARKPHHQRDYVHFTGSGIDADPYQCSGIIHALPPQHGIPGWQRITMMKVFGLGSSSASSSQPTSAPQGDDPFVSSSSNGSIGLGKSNGASTAPVAVDESYWAYEGVVLPGGMIMLGRWWSPADETVDRLGTGPFIFWNVDDN